MSHIDDADEASEGVVGDWVEDILVDLAVFLIPRLGVGGGLFHFLYRMSSARWVEDGNRTIYCLYGTMRSHRALTCESLRVATTLGKTNLSSIT